MPERIKYAMVGAGGRSTVYLDAMAGTHREHCQVVALCDPSPTRMAWHNQRLAGQFNVAAIATYAPAAFDQMVRERRPQTVIITTPDYLHHEYAIRAMNAGCDVICEKPVTIDAAKLRLLYQTIERTGKKLIVTLNARYMPEMLAIKRVILDGHIGRPLAADLSWVLDTSHGADYFRRWHREKEKSGGLLVHKASHHFDLINWFVGSYPQQVFAFGDLKFYGRKNAAERGETYNFDRYSQNPGAAADPFALSLDRDELTRKLYKDAEKDSGYVRDRNVFGDGITIEDTISLAARYHNGVLLNYSLLAYSPWEGLRLAITGTKGRVELYARYSAHILNTTELRKSEFEAVTSAIRRVTVFPMFGLPFDIPVEQQDGGHGGADAIIMNELFSPTPGPDPLGCRSTPADAAASVLLGIAANESIATGSPVYCDELFTLKPLEAGPKD
jgi:predicted dehydrogenase